MKVNAFMEAVLQKDKFVLLLAIDSGSCLLSKLKWLHDLSSFSSVAGLFLLILGSLT